MIADVVWQYLGDDVKQYIEPFFGSGAVLLKRPKPKIDGKVYEIVNDKDGFIANVWRSIIFSPDDVAMWCDWPTNHADLTARKKALLENEGKLLENLVNDDMWYDAKMAGYWIWSASCWIGAGLTCKGQRPHLTHDNGINSSNSSNAYKWIHALHARLRHVKVVCGDWTRVCGGNWQHNNNPVGMFFDPPYATKGRHEKLYHHDSIAVAKDVEKWVLERGKMKEYRIVVAGYDDEYGELVQAGWRVHNWKANGGYSNLGEGKGRENTHRERLYISPYCIKQADDFVLKNT